MLPKITAAGSINCSFNFFFKANSFKNMSDMKLAVELVSSWRSASGCWVGVAHCDRGFFVGFLLPCYLCKHLQRVSVRLCSCFYRRSSLHFIIALFSFFVIKIKGMSISPIHKSCRLLQHFPSPSTWTMSPSALVEKGMFHAFSLSVHPSCR